MATAATPDAVTTKEAALALGVDVRQVRRYIHQGSPVVHQGAGGRGHRTLVRVAELRAWRNRQVKAREPVTVDLEAIVLTLGRAQAALVGQLIDEQLRAATGAHKPQLIQELVALAPKIVRGLAAQLNALGTDRQLPLSFEPPPALRPWAELVATMKLGRR